MYRSSKVAVLLLTTATTPVFASGFSFGENGTKALSLGGAFAGQADDLTAIQHNPAGLVQLSGSQFMVESQLLYHQVRFQRRNPNGSTGNSEPVDNNGGAFWLPSAGLSQHVETKSFLLTIAAGVYGPPSVGRYVYSRPNYEVSGGSYVEDPRKFAAQRYAIIENDIIILYPSLTLAVGPPNKRFGAGLSLQYVYSQFKFSQAIFSGLSSPTSIGEENPDFDSVIAVNLRGRPSWTYVLGLWAQPLDQLAVGVSVRPPVRIRAPGTMSVALGEKVKSDFGAEVIGQDVELDLTLPLEVKVGTHFTPTRKLGINFDFVYEGWQSVRDLTLTPKDIRLRTSVSETALEPIRIPKNFRHAWGLRVGGEYQLPAGVALRLGALYERAAAPVLTTNLDFPHFTRVFLTGGLSYGFSVPSAKLELYLSSAYLPPSDRVIRNSEVRQINPVGFQGNVIGLGTYQTSGVIGAAGIRGQFGGTQR